MGHLCVQQHIITFKSEFVAVAVVVKIRLHKFADTSIINDHHLFYIESMVVSGLGGGLASKMSKKKRVFRWRTQGY